MSRGYISPLGCFNIPRLGDIHPQEKNKLVVIGHFAYKTKCKNAKKPTGQLEITILILNTYFYLGKIFIFPLPGKLFSNYPNIYEYQNSLSLIYGRHKL